MLAYIVVQPRSLGCLHLGSVGRLTPSWAIVGIDGGTYKMVIIDLEDKI